MFGNVNVDYKPCKSVTQLKNAADYILGRQASQIRDSVVKTADNLYWGMNCDRDNFARDVQLTRQIFGKRKSKNAILAHKMSISFHPDDNDKIDYHTTGTNGADSGNVTKTGVFIRRERKGGSERRESRSSDSSHAGNVPDFAGLFNDYQKRNAIDSRQRNEEPEHTRTVRKNRGNCYYSSVSFFLF